MLSGNPLIPEVPVDFKHLFHSPDQKPLEIKFRRDAQIKIHSHRMMLRFKRLGGSSARDGLHHRGFDFGKALGLEELPDKTDQTDAQLKGFS